MSNLLRWFSQGRYAGVRGRHAKDPGGVSMCVTRGWSADAQGHRAPSPCTRPQRRQPWKWLQITALPFATPPGLMRLFAWGPQGGRDAFGIRAHPGVTQERPFQGLVAKDGELDQLGQLDQLDQSPTMLPILRVKKCHKTYTSVNSQPSNSKNILRFPTKTAQNISRFPTKTAKNISRFPTKTAQNILRFPTKCLILRQLKPHYDE